MYVARTWISSKYCSMYFLCILVVSVQFVQQPFNCKIDQDLFSSSVKKNWQNENKSFPQCKSQWLRGVPTMQIEAFPQCKSQWLRGIPWINYFPFVVFSSRIDYEIRRASERARESPCTWRHHTRSDSSRLPARGDSSRLHAHGVSSHLPARGIFSCKAILSRVFAFPCSN